jgi:uncharacterized membrane protein
MAVKVKPMNAGWILAAVYCAGAIGLLVPQTAKFMRQLIWPSILFTNILLLCYHKKWTKEFFFSILLLAFTGFLIDVLAVKTGIIFGYFQYGYILGYKFWDVPLIMMSYWLTIIYTSRQVAEMMAKDTFLVSVLAAACMLLMDYFLEPFAIKYGLWHWNGGDVPIHDYIGWFVCGLLIQYIYCKSIKNPPNKLSLVTYLVQLGFFITLFFLNR